MYKFPIARMEATYVCVCVYSIAVYVATTWPGYRQEFQNKTSSGNKQSLRPEGTDPS